MIMTVNCPFCHASYEVSQDSFGQYVTCEKCKKGFVIGQTPKEGNRNEKLTFYIPNTEQYWIEFWNKVKLVVPKVVKFIGVVFACGVLVFSIPIFIDSIPMSYHGDVLENIAKSLAVIKFFLAVFLSLYILQLCKKSK